MIWKSVKLTLNLQLTLKAEAKMKALAIRVSYNLTLELVLHFGKSPILWKLDIIQKEERKCPQFLSFPSTYHFHLAFCLHFFLVLTTILFAIGSSSNSFVFLLQLKFFMAHLIRYQKQKKVTTKKITEHQCISSIDERERSFLGFSGRSHKKVLEGKSIFCTLI